MVMIDQKKSFEFKQPNHQNRTILSGMVMKIMVLDEVIKYNITGRVKKRDEETDLWRDLDVFEETIVLKELIGSITFQFTNTYNLWEVWCQVCGVTDDVLCFHFNADDRSSAEALYEYLKEWRFGKLLQQIKPTQ